VNGDAVSRVAAAKTRPEPIFPPRLLPCKQRVVAAGSEVAAMASLLLPLLGEPEDTCAAERVGGGAGDEPGCLLELGTRCASVSEIW